MRTDAAGAGAATAVIGAVARLSRAEESPTTAAKHDGVNLTDTSVSGCINLATA